MIVVDPSGASDARDPVEAELVPKGPDKPRSLVSQVVATTAANIAIGALGVATGILGARLLGAQGRGELAAIQTWPLCLATIATLGLPEALVYFAARKPAAIARYLATGATLEFLGSLFLCLLGYFALPTLLAEQAVTTIRFAQAYLVIVFLYPVFTLAIASFRRAQFIPLWNALRIAPTAGWLLVLIGSFFAGRRQPGFLAVCYLAVLLTLLVAVVFLLRRFLAPPFQPSRLVAREMLAFSVPTLFSVIPQLMNTRLDQLIIAGFLPAKSLGLYVVAVAWSSIPNPLLYGLGTVLFPHVAQLKRSDDQNRAFAAGSRVGAALCVLVLAVLAAATPWCVPALFGRDFQPAVPVAFVLAAAGSISAFNLILEEGFRGLGRPKAVMYAEIGGMITMALALFCLLPILGLLGAGVACLAAYSVVNLLLLFQARKVTGLRLVELLWPRKSEIFRVATQLWAQIRPQKPILN